MSIDGVDGSNGVNAQTNTSGLSKAANEENEDTSIFENNVFGTVANIAENAADKVKDTVESFSEIQEAWKQEREDNLAEAKEHFSNGEILQGLASGTKAIFLKGGLAHAVGDATEQNKLNEES